MSVVYYGNYLTYFEVGRVEYLRQHGLPMSEVDKRIRMPVAETYVKFIKPALLDDLLEVTSWVSERKRASFKFAYEIRNETKERVAEGFTRHACLDPASSHVVPIPGWLRDIMADADLDPVRERRR